MRKIAATILSCLALGVATTGVFTRADAPLTKASAEAASPLLVATTEGYTAVARGSSLYLFNRDDGGVWQEYAHAEEILQAHFLGDSLYFLDRNSDLFALDVPTLDDETKATAPLYQNCDLFATEGDRLYRADISARDTAFYADGETQGYVLNALAPVFCAKENTLYAVDVSSTLHKIPLDGSESKPLATLPQGTTAITLLEGVLYGVNGSSIYGYTLTELTETASYEACTPTLQKTGAYASLDSKTGFVYAACGEEIQTYSTQTGEWTAEKEFSLTTEKNIPTENVESDLTAETAAFEFVKTADGALLIEVTLEAGDSAFTWVSSKRAESITAIQISQTQEYALLAYRKDAASKYQTYLVSKKRVEVDPSVTQTIYAESKTGYLTGKTGFYKYPAMGLEELAELPRDEQLTLVGELNGLDCDYFIVERQGKRGYVPKLHVTLFSGKTEQTTTTAVGDSAQDRDGIWRLSYLLLGGVAICILTDFLILRKRNKH